MWWILASITLHWVSTQITSTSIISLFVRFVGSLLLLWMCCSWSCSTWLPAMEQQHSENAPFAAGWGSRRIRARRTSLQQHFPQLHDEDKKQTKKCVSWAIQWQISIQESLSSEKQLEINKNMNRRSPNDNWVKWNCSRWVMEHQLEDCAGKPNSNVPLTIWLHLLSCCELPLVAHQQQEFNSSTRTSLAMA